ncbi:hypothetical protein AMTRI_Chr01g127020 [Amborella trichopoda]
MDQSVTLLQLKARKLEKRGNVFVLTLTGNGKHQFNPSSIEDITKARDFVHMAPGPKALTTTNEGLPTCAAINGHGSAGGFIFALVHDYRHLKNDKVAFYMGEIDHEMLMHRSWMSVITEKVPPFCLKSVVLKAHKFAASDALWRGLVDGFMGCSKTNLEQAMREGNALVMRKCDMEVYASLRCRLYSSMIEELEAHTDPYSLPKCSWL